MTDIRDLKAALARHEHLAPPPDGLIEGAYLGARRVRRRRLTASGLAVVTVIALGAVGPGLLDRLDDDGPGRVAAPAATKPPAAPVAKPPAVTIDVDRSDGFFPLEQGFSGTTALATIRTNNVTRTGAGGDVGVYAPADVDTAAIEAGEAVTVQGHPARYVENYLIDPAAYHQGPENITAPKPGGPDENGKIGFLQPKDTRAPVVAWRDASGSWVIVSGTNKRTELLRVADAVRLRPTGVTTPYRLNYVPDTLRLDYGGSSTYTPSESNSVLVFGAAANPVLKRSDLLGLTEVGALRIQLMASDSGRLDIVSETGPPTVLGGYDTWYFTKPGAGLNPPKGGAILVAKVNECETLITVQDNNLVPYPVLRKMFETASFTTCAAPDTWVAPLS
ncbi:hypothetical protein ACWGR4_16160 [Embleya sp. NPDC055664]